jgi:L-cysteine:1D-myo-inositol 2-amino-2-deoxy-alpha-D-glucopyranoside ligase
MVIRLVLLDHHHATDWEFTDEQLTIAQERLDTWRRALSGNSAPEAEPLLAALRERLADDLDSPGALAAMDAWAARSLDGEGADPTAAGVVARALDALLGVRV